MADRRSVSIRRRVCRDQCGLRASRHHASTGRADDRLQQRAIHGRHSRSCHCADRDSENGRAIDRGGGLRLVHLQLSLAAPRSALGIDHFLLANTHTHAGPSMRQDDFPSPEKPWRRTVEERILAAVAEAQKNLFPAHFAVSTGELQLGYNRLVRQPEGHAVTHFDNPERIPYGPVDPTVTVMRLTDATDAVRLVLVAYACHPVVLGPRNSKISAGYPGVLRAMIEDGVGNDAKCVSLQGGAGDINPLMIPRSKEPQEDFAFVKTMGTLLGDKVLAILERMKAVKGRSDSLDVRSKIIEVEHRFIAQNSVTLGVSSLLINCEIGIVTMPGEPFHLFQEYLRDRAALPHTLFLGYCSNGGYPWPSYVPDLMSAARGGYGASDTTDAAVGTGERLLNLGVSQLY